MLVFRCRKLAEVAKEIVDSTEALNTPRESSAATL